MTPRIKSKQLVTLVPIALDKVELGDVVLCRVHGNQYLHLVSQVADGRVQISNNHGHVNGWSYKVYGKVISVED